MATHLTTLALALHAYHWTLWCVSVACLHCCLYSGHCLCTQHPVILEVAKKYNKHPLVVLIRWGIQHGTSVLAKSSNPHHIRVLTASADLPGQCC